MFDFAKFSTRPAIHTSSGEHLTYGELDEITHISVPRGLVFCMCRNDLPSLVGYLTCLQSGLPAVMLNAATDRALIASLMEVYQPEYIWDGGLKETGLHGSETHPDLVLCLTTSGSTGSPKLVRLSAGNILSNARSIAEYLHIDENERPITTLPMYYSYGLSVINSHLIKGAAILLTDATYVQREFWQFLKEGRATSIAGVPYTYEILKKLRFMRMDLPYLKTMMQAGGKLNENLAKEYIEFAAGCEKKFYVMYGQTEATARISYLPWEHAIGKYSSIGVAIPGGKLSIVDDSGAVITDSNVDGELVYEGENVSMGYAESRTDLARGDENHGVLHTGDIARMDSDGFFYITGRLKRFVKIWGNRCNLDAVEQMAKSITSDVAAAGVDDHLTVFVTETGLEDRVIRFLVEKTGLNSRAFEVKVLREIPKNDSGKVLYAELQALL